jgi:hypothetical protein
VWAENSSNPIAFRSWDDICKPKTQGALGIRDMELINKSLLIHTAWNIVTDKNPFLSNVPKAKYYPNTSFWTAPSMGPRSVFWSSVLQVLHHLNENYIIQIHAGNSSIWSSPWMNSWNTIHEDIFLPVINTPLLAKISDLWLQGTTNWNQELLSTTFSPRLYKLLSIPQLSSHQMRIFSDGNHRQMVNALPNPLTNSYSFSKPTPSPLQAPVPYLPILTLFFRKFGKLKPCLPFSKPLPGASLDRLYLLLRRWADLPHT